jgi:hypothetical protein
MDTDDYSIGEEESLDGESVDSSMNGSVGAAREDIKLMNVVRAIVILILLTLAFISSEAVFVIATIAEENNFKSAYQDASKKLVNEFYQNIQDKLWVARTLTTELSTSVNSQAFPEVTFPNFASRCIGPLHISQAASIHYAPFVHDTTRVQFGKYATASYNATLQTMSLTYVNETSKVSYLPTGRSSAQGVYHFDGSTAKDENASSFFTSPIWQMAPLPVANASTGLIGTLFDQMSTPVRNQALEYMVTRGGGVISNFLYNDTNGTDFAIYASPESVITYPLQDQTSSPVASIGMHFEWEPVFNVPDYFAPLTIVLDNSCGGVFTYSVNHMDAHFVGKGDLHDKKVFGFTLVKSSYDDFANLFKDHGDVPIDSSVACNYKITVYPSQNFQDGFKSAGPNIYRGVVLATFFGMVGIFVCYDCLIESRQAKVVTAAQRSDAIVRSLFPEAVRDKLYENAMKKEEDQKRNNQWKNKDGGKGMIMSEKQKIKQFMDQSPEDQAAHSGLHGDLIIGDERKCNYHDEDNLPPGQTRFLTIF